MKKSVFMMSLVAAVMFTSCASKKDLEACQQENKSLQANYTDTKEKLAAATTRGKEEKGTTENEMAGWHHRLHGHEFE